MFYAISTASNNASAFCFLVAAVRRGIPKWKTEKGRKKGTNLLNPVSSLLFDDAHPSAGLCWCFVFLSRTLFIFCSDFLIAFEFHRNLLL